MRRQLKPGLMALAMLTAATAVQLRYKLAVGQEHKYKDNITAAGTLTLQSALGDQALPITLSAETTRNLKVTGPADAGRFWLESRTLQTKANANAAAAGGAAGGGEEGGGGLLGGLGDGAMPPVNYKMKMDELGNVTEMEMLKAEAAAAAPAVDLDLNEFAVLGQVAGFPADDVPVGGTWDKELKLKGKDGTTVTAKTHNKLLSLNGAEAKLDSTFDVPIPQTSGKMKLAGLDVPVTISGRATGRSLTLHNLDKGCVTRVEGTTNIELKLSLMGTPATGRFVVTAKTNLADD